MTVPFLRGSAVAIVFAFAAQTAHADLTAQDVWTEWRGYLSSTGYEVTADEAASGANLVLENIRLKLKIPEENADVTLILPSITLIQNGDGTVNAEFPSPMPINFTANEDGSEAASGEVVLTHTGSSMQISGDPKNMSYVNKSDTAELTLSNLVVDGKAAPEGALKVLVSLTGIDSAATVSIGNIRSINQQASIASVTYDLAFDDPESDDGGTFTGALQGLSFGGDATIPLELNPSDMNAMLQAGFAMKGGFSYTAGNSSIQGTGEGESFSATTSSKGGSVDATMNAAELAYDLKSQGTAVNVTTQQLPFPVSMEMATAAFRLAVPVAKSDTAQDFSFGLTLGDFTMSDMIWGMFDPAGALPRDPATVALDLTGKAKLDVDLMDPAQAAMMGDTPPGQVESLTINNLLVSMVGAKLSGTGDVTFDNSDLVTYGGMPKPAGTVNLELAGANALIDKLIQMGFVSDQDAMGARMMMGMLAVPGDGPDTLKSTLEMNEQGHIMANGQRIK